MVDAGLARVRAVIGCGGARWTYDGVRPDTALRHAATGCDACLSLLVAAIRKEALQDPRAVPDLAAAQEKALEATRSARGCGAELFYGVSHYLARSYVTNCHQCAILFGEAYAAAMGFVPAPEPTREPCKRCRGKGFVGGNPYPCQSCHGWGSIPVPVGEPSYEVGSVYDGLSRLPTEPSDTPRTVDFRGPRGEEVERIVRETLAIAEYRGRPHFDSYEEWVEWAVARVHARLGRKEQADV